jgi:XTP/dITP diphosphohydrolase
MTTLVIATRNLHKVEEIRAILGKDFACRSLTEFPDAPPVVEDAPTFAGNARKKAVVLAEWLGGLPDDRYLGAVSDAFVLADDSGLEVNALNGAPGVHSARFAALDSSQHGNTRDADNNAKLLRLLAEVPEGKRMARFRCVLALTPVTRSRVNVASPVCFLSDAEVLTEVFEGACEGRIAFAPRGNGGFGYDPLFVPSGFNQSFGELGEAVKNGLSHRARALEKLRLRFRAEQTS